MTSDVVLITGGAGFIGSALAHRLSAMGTATVVVDSLHPQVHGSGSRMRALPADTRVLPGDVVVPSNWDAVFSLVGMPRAIVHLAAETGTGQSLTEASRHAGTNVVGTTQMLDAMSRRQETPARIVLASSRAVYGEGAWTAGGHEFYPGPRSHEDLVAGHWDPRSPSGEPARPLPSRASETVPHPSSVYGATKLAQEHILTAWAAAHDTSVAILRLQNVYGPGQSLTNSYTGIVALFSQMARRRDVIEIYEDGVITRDFVYISDVVAALVAALAGTDETLVDIGSGQATTVAELAHRLTERGGGPAPKTTGRFRDGDVRAASCDISDAAEQLGYQPQFDLDRGLDALLAWLDEDG